MAGYGTMKHQTTALNLGYPKAFADTYAVLGAPEGFERGEDLPNRGWDSIGDDFQASYHQEKKRDADRMANAKVQSTVNMNARSYSSFNNIYGMPKPVLGQRKFANASFGAGYNYSARQDQPGSPWTIHYTPQFESVETFQGGVLRSSAGQRYGKQILTSRIGQLNTIETGLTTFAAARAGLGDATKVEFPGAKGNEFNNELTSVGLVELAQVLQTIMDATLAPGGAQETAIDRFTVTDSVRAFALIVRAATDNAPADINNILEFLRGHSTGDGILPNLDELLTRRYNHYTESQGSEWQGRSQAEFDDGDLTQRKILYLKEFWTRITEYLEEMAQARYENRPKKSILSLSKSLIQKLGFTKLIQNMGRAALDTKVREKTLPPPDFMAKFDKAKGMDVYSKAGFSGAFINPTREDSERDTKRNGLATFTPDQKRVTADFSGANMPPTGGRGVAGFSSGAGNEAIQPSDTRNPAEEAADNEAEDEVQADDALEREERAQAIDELVAAGGGGGGGGGGKEEEKERTPKTPKPVKNKPTNVGKTYLVSLLRDRSARSSIGKAISWRDRIAKDHPELQKEVYAVVDDTLKEHGQSAAWVMTRLERFLMRKELLTLE